jgi:hypothetical protein
MRDALKISNVAFPFGTVVALSTVAERAIAAETIQYHACTHQAKNFQRR